MKIKGVPLSAITGFRLSTELLRTEVDPDLPVSHLAVFLFVAERTVTGQHPQQNEIAAELGLDETKVSRSLEKLAKYVDRYIDPTNYRARRVRLSEAGTVLMRRLAGE